jgi:small basic protein (TIGR04137 family)
VYWICALVAVVDWLTPFEKFDGWFNVAAHLKWQPERSPANSHGNNFMSQHRSLKGASTIAAKRNVLKRFERVELLKKRGQWKEGQKVVGLPKTKPDV